MLSELELEGIPLAKSLQASQYLSDEFESYSSSEGGGSTQAQTTIEKGATFSSSEDVCVKKDFKVKTSKGAAGTKHYHPLSKIDWNLKYSFPKKIKTSAGAKVLNDNLFEYEEELFGQNNKSMIGGKIDIINKHLEKKIMK